MKTVERFGPIRCVVSYRREVTAALQASDLSVTPHHVLCHEMFTLD